MDVDGFYIGVDLVSSLPFIVSEQKTKMPMKLHIRFSDENQSTNVMIYFQYLVFLFHRFYLFIKNVCQEIHI